MPSHPMDAHAIQPMSVVTLDIVLRCFGAAIWALVLLAAALEHLQLIISWRLWMVLDP